ncbi:PH domain-containing protein [Halobacterium sp. KA-6]|uniref:PH domain-containing protein n=1 Tax=Halobacterium sp. KA-6 TaxID=2896368 RepID=UPI001E5FEEA5|nr:PH domain-containing protein [Halobacterium sp. KA-6]MCD2204347.1 PH domain-containing protein [Halobacterium sp. KA-6]
MKLHPLSIPVRVVSRAVGIVWAFIFAGFALAGGDPLLLSGVVVLAVVVLAGLAGYEVAYYRRFDYELTDESLDISSGVFSRRDREIPLRRVQNVDVTRSFVARLLGIAVVDVETAGGGGTEANLRFVGGEEADRLQEAIRAKRAALQREEGEEAETEEAEAAASAGGETLFELSDRDLVLYGALSFDPRLASGVVALATFLAPTFGDRISLSGLGIAAIVGFAVVAALALWAASAVARIVQFYGFRLRRVGDDLRYERGLLSRHDGTIPLSKLQTVAVEENVLMRRFGFASLAVETAGYAPGSQPSGGSEAAIPIAPREDVLSLAQTLEPFHDFEVERPPERARKRYVRRYLLVGLAVVATGFLVDQFLTSVPWYAAGVLLLLAWPAARLTHRHRGYEVGPDHVVTQGGFWNRSTRIVPYRRIQTVIRRQTVFQQRWRLATVIFDTAGSRSISAGDAAALDRDEDDADSIAVAVRDRVLDVIYERDRK